MDITWIPTAAGDGQAGDFLDAFHPYEFLVQLDDIEATPEVSDEESDYFIDSISKGLFFNYIFFSLYII